MKTRGVFGLGMVRWVGAVLVAWGFLARTGAAESTTPPPPEVAAITFQAPAEGARFQAPGPIVFEAQAVDPAGDIRHLDFYANDQWIGASDYLLKIAVIPGRPIPHRLEWKGVAPGKYRVWAKGKDTLGKEVTSAGRTIEVAEAPGTSRLVLVDEGAAWKYRYDGVDRKDGWRDPELDDAEWPSGPAPLGFGDGDEKTVIRTGKAPHPVTAYFRREFQVPADAGIDQLVVRLLRDDGAVVYLNGKELVRDNLPDGVVAHETLATRSTEAENAFRSFLVGASGLKAGRNELAVEVHQADVESSDLGFDLALIALLRQPDAALPRVSLEATRPATSEPVPWARIAPGQFTLRRTGETGLPLLVWVKWDGTATAERDYAPVSSPVLIPAGKSETTVEVVALEDEAIEGTETVTGRLVVPLDLGGPLALPGLGELLPWLGYVIDSDKSSAEVRISDADLPREAAVVLLSPAPESRHAAGSTLVIEALGYDPKGYVPRVEFFAGDQSIGVSSIEFIQAPEPGTPIRHEVAWKAIPAGTHKLTAKGTSSTGATLVSRTVTILVPAPPEQTVLALETVDGTATEPGPGGGGDSGVIRLRRVSGRDDVPLVVGYRIGGSAENGVDYTRLSGRVELPRGESRVDLAIRPLADLRVEGDEKVELTLETPACAEIFPPPADCYRLSERTTASVVIRDRALPGATLKLTSPADGATYEEGATIPLRATAVDPAGSISRVEFFDGETRVGVSEVVFVRAPDPGTPIEHTFDWKGAATGSHRLSARAKASDGTTVTSATAMIRVTDPDDSPKHWLLNVNFGLWKTKKGPAATGVAETDFWNPWEHVYQPDVVVDGLKLADGRGSDVVMRVRNAGGSWNNASGDGMYDSYVYPNSGEGDGVGNIVVNLRGVPAGAYDLYLYGHADPAGRPESDSVFTAVAGNVKFGPKGTASSAGWKVEQGWKEGFQYVAFRGVKVDAAGLMEIVVQPGFDGVVVPDQPQRHVAVLNGLQLKAAESQPSGKLSILEPRAGASLPAGQPAVVRVEAVDDRGGITRVELLDGTELIGVSEIVFIVPPAPGVPIVHEIAWKDPKPGSHTLVARAVDTSGMVIHSGRVPVTVGNDEPPPEQVVLAVEVVDGVATEPSANTEPDGATVRVRRVRGPSNVAIPVQYEVAGDAENGRDYTRLPGTIVLEKGAESVTLRIQPLADSQKEGEEEVVIRLENPACIAIFPPPPQCYRVGEPGEAVVVIRDGSAAGNLPPRVAITSPRNGAVVTEGEDLAIRAEASDADGSVALLEIRVGEVRLGSAEKGVLEVVWKDAPSGLHKLTARAVDNLGRETQASPVTVFVRKAESLAFVRRELPPAYLPGGAVEVVLVAEPPRSVSAWTVEDQPPGGWKVTEVSDDGAFDAATGRVKFGPFTDGRDRRLSYRLQAAPDRVGPQTFTGTSSADGKSYPVTGETVLPPAGEYHPADVKPQDKSLNGDELTAYAAAWKQGRGWEGDSSPIPLAYVTRAGQIWKRGEAYVFDPLAGAPPLCWAPPAPKGPALANAPDRTAGGVERKAPVVWRPGKAGEVRLSVVPPTGTFAAGIEERVPAGWQVKSVSGGGQFDASAGRIRWGLVFGADPFELSYELVPPGDAACNAELIGLASFDGSEVTITGLRHAGAMDEITTMRIAGSRRDEHGRLHLRVEAAADQVFAVEASSDLVNWSEVATGVNTGEELDVDDAPAGAGHRYFRLRPVGR